MSMVIKCPDCECCSVRQCQEAMDRMTTCERIFDPGSRVRLTECPCAPTEAQTPIWRMLLVVSAVFAALWAGLYWLLASRVGWV